jgi:hypothetical protein
MTLNQEYSFEQVEALAEIKDMYLEELGNGVIGETFIVLRSNKKDITISFMLNRASSKGYFYKCIYTDLK